MSSFKKIEFDLYVAIDAIDIEKIHEIHLNNPDLMNNSARARDLLLELAVTKQHGKVAKLIVNSLHDVQFEVELEHHFQKVLYNEDLTLAKFMLEKGVKLSVYEWRDSVWNKIFSVKEMLMLLIKYGLDVGFQNKLGQNLLHIFFNSINQRYCNPIDTVEILLNAGVSLDKLDNNGYSPFHSAVLSEHLELVSYLIKKGASVDLKINIGGYFPLFLAAHRNNVNLINLLISNGADINAKSAAGTTALHAACDNHCKNAIFFLIQKGASVSAEDNRSRTPFSILIAKRFWEKNCSKVIIREIAKQKLFGTSAISKIDMNLIQAKPEYQKYLHNCIMELSKMASTQFYPPYSYSSIFDMTGNIKKLANLTRNKEFVRKFKKQLSFLRYKNDLLRIYQEATELRDNLENVHSRLSSMFGDILPDLVISKVSESLTVEDLPLK